MQYIILVYYTIKKQKPEGHQKAYVKVTAMIVNCNSELETRLETCGCSAALWEGAPF